MRWDGAGACVRVYGASVWRKKLILERITQTRLLATLYSQPWVIIEQQGTVNYVWPVWHEKWFVLLHHVSKGRRHRTKITSKYLKKKNKVTYLKQNLYNYYSAKKGGSRGWVKLDILRFSKTDGATAWLLHLWTLSSDPSSNRPPPSQRKYCVSFEANIHKHANVPLWTDFESVRIQQQTKRTSIWMSEIIPRWIKNQSKPHQLIFMSVSIDLSVFGRS